MLSRPRRLLGMDLHVGQSIGLGFKSILGGFSMAFALRAMIFTGSL